MSQKFKKPKLTNRIEIEQKSYIILLGLLLDNIKLHFEII